MVVKLWSDTHRHQYKKYWSSISLWYSHIIKKWLMQAHSEFLVSCTKIGMLAQTGTSLRLGSCTCRVWIHVVDFKWRPLYIHGSTPNELMIKNPLLSRGPYFRDTQTLVYGLMWHFFGRTLTVRRTPQHCCSFWVTCLLTLRITKQLMCVPKDQKTPTRGWWSFCASSNTRFLETSMYLHRFQFQKSTSHSW